MTLLVSVKMWIKLEPTFDWQFFMACSHPFAFVRFLCVFFQNISFDLVFGTANALQYTLIWPLAAIIVSIDIKIACPTVYNIFTFPHITSKIITRAPARAHTQAHRENKLDANRKWQHSKLGRHSFGCECVSRLWIGSQLLHILKDLLRYRGKSVEYELIQWATHAHNCTTQLSSK